MAFSFKTGSGYDPGMGETAELLSLWAFDRKCLRLAFQGKKAIAEGVSGTGSLLAIPFGLWLGDAWGPEMTWLPFVIFFSVFVGTVSVGLWLAPHQIYREAAERAALAQQNLLGLTQSGITFEFEDRVPFRIPQIGGSARGPLRCYRFQVKNEGLEQYASCKVLLVSATGEDGTEMIHISPTLQTQSGDEVFSLRRGESKIINLFAMAESDGKHIYNVMHVASVGENWPYFGPQFTSLPRANMIVRIQIVSEGAPTQMKLRFERTETDWSLTRLN